MKALLDSLRGQKIWLFLEVNSISVNICGTLVGGRLPGQPYGVHIEVSDDTFDNPRAEISFTASSVDAYHKIHGIYTFKLK